MKTLKTIVIALALMLFVTAAAEAVNLFTAPLFASDVDSLACEIVNVSNGSRLVRIQLIGNGGNVVIDSGNVLLAAGEVGTVDALGGAISGSGYCQFTVTSKFHFRAGAKIHTDSSSDFVFAPAQ